MKQYQDAALTTGSHVNKNLYFNCQEHPDRHCNFKPRLCHGLPSASENDNHEDHLDILY